MDPTEALLACKRAILAQDYDGARCYLDAYTGWRMARGFEPVLGTAGRGDAIAIQLANATGVLEAMP